MQQNHLCVVNTPCGYFSTIYVWLIPLVGFLIIRLYLDVNCFKLFFYSRHFKMFFHNYFLLYFLYSKSFILGMSAEVPLILDFPPTPSHTPMDFKAHYKQFNRLAISYLYIDSLGLVLVSRNRACG